MRRGYGSNVPLKMEQTRLKEMGDNDVFVEIKAAGICHSELHTLHGRMTPTFTPITLGHEALGVIVDKGKNVSNVKNRGSGRRRLRAELWFVSVLRGRKG